MYFIKGKTPTTFNPPRVSIQTCRHCGKDIKDYGGHKSKLHPSGLNITDIWSDIPIIRHAKFKTRCYANELSLKLIDRILDISTVEGNIVLDPFGGSGTTYVAAELKNRRWIGSEIGPCDIIKLRFANLNKESANLEWYCCNKNKLYSSDLSNQT